MADASGCPEKRNHALSKELTLSCRAVDPDWGPNQSWRGGVGKIRCRRDAIRENQSHHRAHCCIPQPTPI